MNTTLKKSYLQIGNMHKVIYDFSDQKYLISVNKSQEQEADCRIKAFFNHESSILKFSDIAEYIKK